MENQIINVDDIYVRNAGWSMVIYEFCVITRTTPNRIYFQVIGSGQVGGDDFHPIVKPDRSNKQGEVRFMSRKTFNIKYSLYDENKQYREDLLD